MDRTADGRSFRMLTIVDEFTRECLAIDVSRKLTKTLSRSMHLFGDWPHIRGVRPRVAPRDNVGPV
jgi:hypothetical protein